MLKNSDKNKVENYIQKIINGLLNDTNKSIVSGMSDKQVIDRITKATVNKISHESKMIISSVYNMLMNDTLSEDFFQEPSNKALFYELNILKKLKLLSKYSINKKLLRRLSFKSSVPILSHPLYRFYVIIISYISVSFIKKLKL